MCSANYELLVGNFKENFIKEVRMNAVKFSVNGKEEVVVVKPNDTLLDVLRNKLGLIGTKDGSSFSEGGWDTVIMDGEAVPASLVLAMDADGSQIETIEGIAASKHLLIKAFVDEEHIQGGYDIPGKIVAAKALLSKNPNPTVEDVVDALSGVLGREGLYPKDIVAVLKAAKMGGKADSKKLDKELKKAEEVVDFKVEKREENAYKYIGTNTLTRADQAYPKATGQARYSRDIQLPNMVYAKWLISPYANARVKKVDSSKAKEIPGVLEIYTWEHPLFKDLPKVGWNSYYPLITNEPKFEGDEAGVIVVAETEELCDKALDMLDIDWEPLPFVLDPEDALKPDAPKIHPEVNPNSNEVLAEEWTLGDVESGFKEADRIIEDKVVYKSKLHSCDDIGTATAWWEGDHLHIWIKAQDPRWREAKISSVLGIPKSNLHLKVAYVGGSCGGDLMVERSGTRDQIAASIISKDQQRPVQIAGRNRRYYFDYHYPVHVAYFKLGVKNDGTITAISLKSIVDNGGDDGGGATFWFPKGWNMPMRYFEIFTRIPNLFHDQHIVWTNKSPMWWARCEQDGTAWIYGAIMNRVAVDLNLDPTEVVLKNACESGVPSLKKAIEIGKKEVEWDKNWHKPGTKLLSNGKYHGIGFMGYWEWGAGAHAAVGLRISEDGSASIVGMTPDTGVGIHPALRYIPAEVLGIDPEKVSFTAAASQTNDVGALLGDIGGSWTTAADADAVWKVCQKAKDVIIDRASKKMMLSPEVLEMRDGKIFPKHNPNESLTIAEAIAPYDVFVSVTTYPMSECDNGPLGSYDCAYGHHRKRQYECFQAHFVEVEVDPETGLTEIKKTVHIHDVGTAMYPTGIAGQIYGGLFMPIGRTLHEEEVWDPKTGALLTTNLKEYKIPTIGEIPDKIVARAIEVGKGPGAYGIVGVGEDTATASLSPIGNAVHNALGVAPNNYESPFTPIKLLEALENKKEVK